MIVTVNIWTLLLRTPRGKESNCTTKVYIHRVKLSALVFNKHSIRFLLLVWHYLSLLFWINNEKRKKTTNSALLPSLGLATDAKSLLKAMVASKFTLSLRDLKNNWRLMFITYLKSKKVVSTQICMEVNWHTKSDLNNNYERMMSFFMICSFVYYLSHNGH